MYALRRLLSFASALLTVCACYAASVSENGAVCVERTDSVATCPHRTLCPQHDVPMITNTPADGTTLLLKSLMGKDLGHDYYVGVTAGHAWRPLENYGDCDCKLRIYDPKVGLSLKYNF